MWPTARRAWRPVLQVPAVSDHPAHSPLLTSHLTVVTVSSVLVPPGKGRLAGMCWSGAPSEHVYNQADLWIKRTVPPEACGVRMCGAGSAAASPQVGWSLGAQCGQSGPGWVGRTCGCQSECGPGTDSVAPSTSWLILEADMIPRPMGPASEDDGMRDDSHKLGGTLFHGAHEGKEC